MRRKKKCVGRRRTGGRRGTCSGRQGGERGRAHKKIDTTEQSRARLALDELEVDPVDAAKSSPLHLLGKRGRQRMKGKGRVVVRRGAHA